MQFGKYKIKLVTLECPYDTWGDGITETLFSRVVQLKLKGYKAEYPYGVLPVDTTDFICTHHMACIEVGKELYPVMAYKSVTSDRLKTHSLPFPLINLLKYCGTKEHLIAVQDIVTKCELNNKKLSYDSSWTIDPEIRKDLSFKPLLREIMNTMHVYFHKDNGTDEILSLGSTRFKMEKLFDYWGYKLIEYMGKSLATFDVPTYFNENVVLIHQSNGFSKSANTDAKKYETLWEEKVVIKSKTQRKVAA